MAKSTLYNIGFQSGLSSGEYEASLADIADVSTNIEFSRQNLQTDLQRIDRTLDTVQSIAELGSTIYGGRQAKKEFEGQDLPAVQKRIAEQQYNKNLKEGQSEFADLDEATRKDFISKFKPIKVDDAGNLYDELSFGKKLFKKPLYRFGGEESSFIYKQSDIKAMSDFAQFGMNPDLKVFQTNKIKKTLYDEASTETPTSTAKTASAGFDFMQAAQLFKDRNQAPIYASWDTGQVELSKAAMQLGWNDETQSWSR